MSVVGRIKHAWNAFLDSEPGLVSAYSGSVYGTRPDRVRMFISNERSIITAIYNRLAVDVASIQIRHVRLDDNGRFKEEMPSNLNNCLRLDANVDQSSLALFIDAAMTLFDRGHIALVPVDTTLNPRISGGFDILSLRVGEIVQWHPRHVRVSLYNDRTGRREQVTLEKKHVAIVENPFYSVMNEPNSTLQRLLAKLALLDVVDKQSSSGKLDLIIQLPYVIKSDARRVQAEQRRKDIEFQLAGSQYGIAYTDGTEKITQLNRPAENNLFKQVEYLVEMLYGQLGLTPEILNGTADEKTMHNYLNRTVEPIVDAIVQELRRKFLTKTARSQSQSIEYFRDPFKLVPITQMPDLADKLTRNEIMSSNEFRSVLGLKPSSDPKADELRNSNMPSPSESEPSPPSIEEGDSQNGS